MERCMILDGSSVIRKVTKRILESEDVLVVEAKNGTEAISMATAQMPEYIIVDAGVHDTNAEDLIRQLKRMDKDNTTKVISCMTEIDLVAMTRAKRAGADEFLLKPFDRRQLVSQFRTLKHAA